MTNCTHKEFHLIFKHADSQAERGAMPSDDLSARAENILPLAEMLSPAHAWSLAHCPKDQSCSTRTKPCSTFSSMRGLHAKGSSKQVWKRYS